MQKKTAAAKHHYCVRAVAAVGHLDASRRINVRILCGLLTLTLTAFSLLSEKARL